LPRWSASAALSEAPRTIGAECTVLLVEDDPLVRRVAERVLHRAGWTVLCAGSAEDALIMLNARHCDLMVSDVALPGMDGVALARRAQASWPAMPIILTSGYQRTATEDGFEAMNFAFLAKPYGQEDLLGAIARMTEDRGRPIGGRMT
jgi:two-component system cell cycle sensor histidine kinase/response regulator CckA